MESVVPWGLSEHSSGITDMYLVRKNHQQLTKTNGQSVRPFIPHHPNTLCNTIHRVK